MYLYTANVGAEPAIYLFFGEVVVSAGFRCGPCCHSQIGWRYNICKVLPGCVITNSKTHQEYTNTGCGWDGLGWVRRMGMGGGGLGWGLGSVGWMMMGARVGAGRDSCGQENGFVYLSASCLEDLVPSA